MSTMILTKKQRASKHPHGIPFELIKYVAEFAPEEFFFANRALYAHIHSKPMIYYHNSFVLFRYTHSKLHRMSQRPMDDFEWSKIQSMPTEIAALSPPPARPWECCGCGITKETSNDKGMFYILNEKIVASYMPDRIQYRYVGLARGEESPLFLYMGDIRNNTIESIYTCRPCRASIDIFSVVSSQNSWRYYAASEYAQMALEPEYAEMALDSV